MIALLSQIVFIQPVILSALLALPIIWYLLRVTPPAPQTIQFPAIRFLNGLNSEENTQSKTPWWIFLLRLLMITLIVIALAGPVINPSKGLPGKDAIRLVIDNSWASAQNWNLQISAAEETIAQAGRENREIYILPTTVNTGQEAIEQFGPLPKGTASSIIRGLQPNPWPADYRELAKYLSNNKKNKPISSIWLSHGLDEGNARDMVKVLQNQGSLSYVSPSQEKLPILLRPNNKATRKSKEHTKSNVSINVDAPENIPTSLPVTVQALGENGNILDIQNIALDNDNLPNTVSFDVTKSMIDKINKFKISNAKGAGSLFLLDDQFKKRKVGIAAPPQSALSAPLIEESYYIKRALEPYANIDTGEITSLINSGVSVIILPDIASMPTETLNALEKWVNEGGLLLHFAGPNMAEKQGEQFLLPVALRTGGRSISGALSWDEPQTIKPFAKSSPFYGLEIPNDVTIRQQVLADPSQDLDNKIWAQLNDGTPLITADKKEKGLIVLIHTSANTQWSDFAISGLYVSVLKRIIRLSGATNLSAGKSYTSLDPLLVMDGFGTLISPPAAVLPISVKSIDKFIPSKNHPPGIYGQGKTQYAINIGTNLPKIIAIDNLPISIPHTNYESNYEISLMPYILYCALILFCIDWLVMIMMSRNGFSSISSRALPFIALFTLMITPYNAQASEDKELQFSKGLYLAYIKTGNPELDALSQRGLESLSNTLKSRTSVEPVGVVGLNPEEDPLAFFPFIYWPISETHNNYSSKAMKRIQYYLDHGGTILFDTRDQNRSVNGTSNTKNSLSLRAITASLNIPPLAPIPSDHVLGKSFYLLKEYPGQFSSGVLWVEQQSVSGRDNVSSVLIGSNNWAGSWASSYNNRKYDRYSNSYDSKQKEMSLRFGVNLIMYVLTGNYKADQVHIPHILKRLGK
ncbi:MAG: DUF4159 domain-containing protein [Alphaproteobacteria bacterium]